MKRTIRIGGEARGVIATGSFQNLRPSFSWEETYDNCSWTDEQIQERINFLYERAYARLEEAEQEAILKRIEREYENIRFYLDPKDLLNKPSVTSVRDWDADFWVTPQELTQYASAGQISHARASHYIKTGKWVEAKEIDDIWADLVIVTRGHLKLPVNVGDFPLFLEKYPIEQLVNGEVVYLEDTAGLPDAHGIPKGWKEALEIPTTFDFKRTPDKLKDGIQLSQYCKAKGHKQGIIIALNDKTAQGYSKPIVYNEKSLIGYGKMFAQKRADFKRRYGI